MHFKKDTPHDWGVKAGKKIRKGERRMELDFVIRLAVAGLLGALIGLEREFRAKEAGLRTHF